jgi:hypothetical protein
MPKSRLRKNRKKPFYIQKIVEKPTLIDGHDEWGEPITKPNPRYPNTVYIKHRSCPTV